MRREVIRCRGDRQALAKLSALSREAAVELWDQGRLVKRLDAPAPRRVDADPRPA
jgi:hypothetical protein